MKCLRSGAIARLYDTRHMGSHGGVRTASISCLWHRISQGASSYKDNDPAVGVGYDLLYDIRRDEMRHSEHRYCAAGDSTVFRV